MKRRSGVTLIEVLVAIFIMAIGLIALLTLFPIGMLRMAQAIRDARTAEAGINANSISIMQDIRHDQAVVSQILDPYNAGNTTADLFANPSPLNPISGLPFPAPGTLPNADPYGESYPILVDPIGFFATPAGASQDWVGGYTGVLRRRSVSLGGSVNSVNIYKNFTLWDDINFDPTNSPGMPQTSGVAILRDTRFSWAYLLRRPQTRDTSVVDCSVIVFDQRALSLTGTLSLEEYVYTGTALDTNPAAVFDPGSNTVTIDWSGNVSPPLRPGDWIMDATFYQRVVNGTTVGAANACFYRVVASDDVPGNPNATRFELQQTIRGYPATGGGAYQGTAIVIRGVAEVFEKGPVRLP
jgi:prepilin-type N-terminal cleavage/methylation domain-containing protein